MRSGARCFIWYNYLQLGINRILCREYSPILSVRKRRIDGLKFLEPPLMFDVRCSGLDLHNEYTSPGIPTPVSVCGNVEMCCWPT